MRSSYGCGRIADQGFVFEIKRWQRPVGRRTVQHLRGALGDFEQFVLVATGGFYPAARRLAEEWRRPIVLVDGERFVELLVDHWLATGMPVEPRLTTVTPTPRLQVA